MKRTTLLAFSVVLVLIIFPNQVYGWKSLIFHMEAACDPNCELQELGNSTSNLLNGIIIAILTLVSFGLFYKVKNLKEYEIFSLKCKKCGRSTNGLKCRFCR